MNEEKSRELIKSLGLDEMNELDQKAVVTEIGDLVMEAVLLRLVAEMKEEQYEALDQFMESEPAPEVLMEHLVTHYKSFNQIWEEEIKAFRDDALSVLGDED